MTENRYAGADFVRAAACLLVVAHHISQRVNPEALSGWALDVRNYFMLGSLGVSAFFVLSGYLLARPFWRALDAGEPLPSLRIYALRRAARIVPGFYLALIVSFLVSFTILKADLDAGLVWRAVSGLLFISDWHWFTLFPVEFNGPLWSIGFEVTSYVLLPLTLAALFFARRFGLKGWGARAAWLVVIGAVLAIHSWIVANFQMSPQGTGWEFGFVGGARYWMPEYNPFAFFAMFALGMGGAGVGELLKSRRHVIFDALGAGGLVAAAMAIAAYIGEDGSGYGFLGIPYAFPAFPLGVAVALATLPSGLFLGRALDNPPVKFIATISFGIYLWHYLFIEVLRELALPNMVYQGMFDVGEWAWASAGIVIASFVVATASYYLLEQPVMRAARKREAGLLTNKDATGTGGQAPVRVSTET